MGPARGAAFINGCCNGSRQQIVDDLAMHIGESEIATFEPIRQCFVVDPQQVHHRRLEVMHVHEIFGNIVAELALSALWESRRWFLERCPRLG